MVVFLLGVFSAVWGALGLLFVVAPVPVLDWAKRVLCDTWWRFWVAQATLVIGLLLIVGTSSLEGRWLWVTCGGIGVVKACWLLGASESFRDRVWQYVSRWPVWLLRCDGVLGVMLSGLLAADCVLHG